MTSCMRSSRALDSPPVFIPGFLPPFWSDLVGMDAGFAPAVRAVQGAATPAIAPIAAVFNKALRVVK